MENNILYLIAGNYVDEVFESKSNSSSNNMCRNRSSCGNKNVNIGVLYNDNNNNMTESDDDDKGNEIKSLTTQVLVDLINNKISSEVAISKCRMLIGSDSPAQSIIAILNTPSQPINYSQPLYNYHSTRHHVRKWSKYEDQRLIAGVYRLGLDNWTKIAEFVGNGRSRSQCSQRWIRGLDPTICKDKWTDEEESKLVELVNEFGTKSWRRISTQIKKRSDVQCRYHFAQMKRFQKTDKILQQYSSASISNPLNTAVNEIGISNTQIYENHNKSLLQTDLLAQDSIRKANLIVDNVKGPEIEDTKGGKFKVNLNSNYNDFQINGKSNMLVDGQTKPITTQVKSITPLNDQLQDDFIGNCFSEFNNNENIINIFEVTGDPNQRIEKESPIIW